MHKKLLLGTGLLLLLAAAAYAAFQGDDQTGRQDTDVRSASELTDQADSVVRITETGFEPEHITVGLGETVVWVNEGSGYYWPASDLHPTHGIYPAFDPREPLAPGEGWAFTFDRAGEWKCHDHLRPNRICSITVTE